MGMEQVLAFAHKGDTIVVWKLDRLGRSLRHLVETLAALRDRRIWFRSLQESIDTTTSGGKLVFHVFAALAEFERDFIRERPRAGLDAARARGKRGATVGPSSTTRSGSRRWAAARTSSWVMEAVSIRWHDPMTNRSVSQLRALTVTIDR